MIFKAHRDYVAALDVRDYQGLDEQLRQPPPDGAMWILIAPRRARKTWTLRAMAHLMTSSSATFLDLRHKELPKKPPTMGHCFLLDEPLTWLDDPKKGSKLVNACAHIHDQGGRLAIAVTPYEFEKLLAYGKKGGRVSEKAIHRIPPLDPSEAKKIALRRPEALALLDELPPIWKRNAFLLELLFELQEKYPGIGRRELVRALLLETETTGIEYFNQVFEGSLTDTHRRIIRRVAQGEESRAGENRALIESNLIEQDGGGHYRLADPILAIRLSSLRIHHVSDIHVGPKAAQAVDAKVPGGLAVAADEGKVRDSYVQHLAALKAHGRAPHLLVISGDLTEWATAEQLSGAKEWVDRVREQLDGHLLLDPTDPRILIVGGNHDVDWQQTRGKGHSARHLPFAETFPTIPRPQLELGPADRKVATARYPDLGVEFLLLGSSELGGEIDEDLERGRLLRELAALTKPATADERKKAEDIALKAARDDAGLVHHLDLVRANAHPWREPVRIAVIHHPVSPLPTVTEIARYAGLLNAGAVKDLLLARRFCLVLHGHAHSSWFCIEEWPGQHDGRKLHIAAAPSLSSRETLEHLGFNEIEIQHDYDEHGASQHRVAVRRFLRKGMHNWEQDSEIPVFVPRP